jgi:hypothetical protein
LDGSSKVASLILEVRGSSPFVRISRILSPDFDGLRISGKVFNKSRKISGIAPSVEVIPQRT